MPTPALSITMMQQWRKSHRVVLGTVKNPYLKVLPKQQCHRASFQPLTPKFVPSIENAQKTRAPAALKVPPLTSVKIKGLETLDSVPAKLLMTHGIRTKLRTYRQWNQSTYQILL